ncbi:ClbS/DfsB family four-helix bundle protein [Flavobacteriaceae bacterium R38]|nr:ClbS/DfsB family four-helix bundle protein [Flavobacteriaceae bacterium R38]
MPRPKSKEELIALSQSNFEKLNKMIISYSDEELKKEFPEGTMNRNIRDILSHLHHWHLMMIEWYTIGMAGEKPMMPAKGYTWKTLPDLNRKIWSDYQNVDINKAKALLKGSFRNVQELINRHSNEELFEKKRYKWTGTTSLGAYFISSTSSHYDWAIKQIKRGMK